MQATYKAARRRLFDAAKLDRLAVLTFSLNLRAISMTHSLSNEPHNSNFQALCDCLNQTERLCDLAKSDEWKNIPALLETRNKLLNEIFADGTEWAEDKPQVREVLLQINASNKELEDLARTNKRDIAEILGKAKKSTKALQQYSSHQSLY